MAGPTTLVAPHRRDVGYVAQDGALFPHLTVAQNVAYGLRERGAAAQARVIELLDTVSLDSSFAPRRHTNSPVASNSGWPWPGHWPAGRC